MKTYLCIDLKSFYASVECVERGLDPMTTDLVVADPERGDKTICLAVSPSLREKGVRNRCRIFEIPEDLTYIVAPPRMKKYIDYSAGIYSIYLDFFDKDDIHVYSIDEAFIDITSYLSLYKMTSRELAAFLIRKIKESFGVQATCGIGTNLFLAKIALDVLAKHSPDYISFLDETLFKERLWDHLPITDFWRIGKGTEKRLSEIGLFTLRDIAHCDPEILYHIFGIDAELLIDHAWGIEPVTIKDIKEFSPKSNSYSSGQVLMRDYTVEETKIIIREMLYELFLKLVRENLLTSHIVLSFKYAKNSGQEEEHFSISFPEKTNQFSAVVEPVIQRFTERINKDLKIRKVTISLDNLEESKNVQMSIFDTAPDNSKDKKIEETILYIKERFGKNAVLKGLDLLDSATTIERHGQIGGHKSGS